MKSIVSYSLALLWAWTTASIAESLSHLSSSPYPSRHVVERSQPEQLARRREPRQAQAGSKVKQGTLYPAVHPGLNKSDSRHLHPRQHASLFYTEPNGDIAIRNSSLVATLDALFHWEAVILDHSEHIKSVACKNELMYITLDSLENFNSAKANWTRDDTILFVSSTKSCHTTYPGQFGYFNTSAVTFNPKTLSAIARGNQITVRQAIREFNIVWGKWEAAGEPSAPQVIASASATSSKQSSSTRYFSRSSSTPSPSGTRKSQFAAAASAAASRHSSTTRSFSRTYKSSSTSRPSGARKSSSTTGASSTPKASLGPKSSSTPNFSRTRSSSQRTISTRRSISTSASRSGQSTTSSTVGKSTSVSSTSTTTTSDAFQSLTPPTGTGICGVVPSVIPSGISPYFKQVPCNSDFDQNVDDFFTYLADVANLDAYLAKWAPNTGITSADIPTESDYFRLARRAMLAKRDLGSFLDGVVSVGETILHGLEAAASAVVNAIKDAAESLLPTWNPSVSFNIPFTLGPLDSMLDESPWGNAYEIYQYKAGEGEVNYGLNINTLAKMTGADQIVTFKIDGVEQLPVPGVTVWCVDCGAKGSFQTTGQATFTITGLTRLNVRMDGHMDAILKLGVDAFDEWEDPVFAKRLFEDGLPGFSIPDIVSIGPYLTLDVDATLKVEALGQILAGIEMTWPKIGGYVDFIDFTKSKSYGFAPQITPVFDASGQVTVTSSLGLPIGINIGVDILEGEFEEAIALVDRPAVQSVTQYSTQGYGDCKGIYFYSNLVNEFELNVFDKWKYDLGSWNGSKFVEGCVDDNGVKTVKTMQQPAPAGKTRSGCQLFSEVLDNGDFNTGDISPWQADAGDATFEVTDDEQGPPSALSFHHEVPDPGFFESIKCLFCGCCEKPYPRSWTGTLQQTIDLCTYTQYNFQLNSRVLQTDGDCKITKAFVNGVSDTRINVEVDINYSVLPVTPQNPINFPLPNAIPIAIPAYDNTPSYKVNFGVEVLCENAEYFDLRIDDLTLSPDISAYSKRGLTPTLPLSSSPDQVPELHARQIQTISKETAAPAISPTNAAPAISFTQSAPTVPAANSAPTIPPSNQAPAFSDIPEANLVTGTIGPNGPIPTATAVQLGPADYSFPAFSDIMASATVGNAGAAPTAGSTAPYTGWGTLPELTQKSRLATGDDGNFYLVSNDGSSPSSTFYSDDSIAWKDESDRMFYYFPDTMDAYGVSRIRVATVLETPLTAQLITLVPTDTSSGVVYLAADTNKGNFLLAWCSAPRWPGSKVFLVADYDSGLQKLQSGDVQWIVTGNNVTDCNPLILTSNSGGLTPV